MMSNGAMQQLYPQLFAQQQQGGANILNQGNGGGDDDVSNTGSAHQDNSRKYVYSPRLRLVIAILVATNREGVKARSRRLVWFVFVILMNRKHPSLLQLKST
jgi:hypothetical protein